MPAHKVTPDPATASSVGVWYVAIIAVLLLVTAGIYIIYLHQQRLQWQDAANQTSIGQELLRVDRDEMLQKVQASEADLTNLEQQFSERETQLASLEAERDKLRDEVATLAQNLTNSEQQLKKVLPGGKDALDLSAAKKERGRDDQEPLEQNALSHGRNGEIERLEASLAETGELLVQYQSDLREQERLATEARLEKTTLQKQVTRLRKEMTETELAFRRSQIIRGHNASLGEVKPYLADVGPEYWQVIEDWLKDKLQREMAIPDLAAVGWTYEGARLLVSIGGPSMVMLLYADQAGNPLSMTIALDLSGIETSSSRQQAGLNLIEWRDHSHAFVLAGEAEDAVLQVVASAVQDQISEITSNSPVPSSRFFLPEFRPLHSERQSSG